MINLLPIDKKKDILSARTNTLLARYVLLLAGVAVFIVAGLVVAYLSLIAQGQQADTTKRSNEAEVAQFSSVQQQATAFRAQLGQAKQLFDQEIRYSEALVRISQSLPQGSALESLILNPQSFTQPSTLTILIQGESAANALKQSFSSSEYFTNVSFGALRVNGPDSPFPYTIDLLVTMNRSIAQ